MGAKTAVDAILVGKARDYSRRFQQMCGHYLADPPKRSARTDRAPRFGPARRPRAGTAPVRRHRFEPDGAGQVEPQVETQVGTVRQRLFSPRLRQRLFSPRLRQRTYEELNDWRVGQCVARAKIQPHPEIGGKTIWEVFESGRPSLVPYRGRFDGFHAVQASVSKTVDVYVDRALRQ